MSNVVTGGIMGSAEFDELAGRLREAADVVNSYTAESVQLKIIDALIDAFHGTAQSRHRPALPPDPASAADGASSAANSSGKGSTSRRRRKSNEGGEKPARSRRSGNPFKIVDKLDLQPKGKEPFEDFIARAQPRSHPENILASAYWFEQIAKELVTGDKIFTVYRLQKWELPKDFSNQLSQAGSKGWLNQSDRENITLTSIGINEVEKIMVLRPPKAKA
jgi:hypothetical protein